MPALTPDQYPAELRHPKVKGVFVGGCVEHGDGSRFRAKAHAHERGCYEGWICVLSAERLTFRELLLHELAHLITPGGHVDAWRKTLLEIGGTLDEVPDPKPGGTGLKSYHKKTRHPERTP